MVNATDPAPVDAFEVAKKLPVLKQALTIYHPGGGHNRKRVPILNFAVFQRHDPLTPGLPVSMVLQACFIISHNQ
ncbi:hypothetical protein DXG03_001129 [Asterophora parasitica]|uniref:Uncharacterized protein n=1 Tax=Asterophora parasitica TaxID=117018 RepID=A0A9P7KF64_9AGAR|nr:hypothetical protein DXG03_001129 [Asterophora parasitica]